MKKILLIDDEPSIRNTFSVFLHNAGYRVTTADMLTTAFDDLRTNFYDVIITDIILPDGSGMEILETVKKENLHCPVIMITGQPTIDNATAALRQGAFDYLLKPVRKERLLSATQNALSHKDLLDGKKLLEEENVLYRNQLEALVKERTKQLTKVNAQLRHEIEERGHAEEALRRHKERLALAMEISGAAEFEAHPLDGLFMSGEALFEMTGYSLQDITASFTVPAILARRMHVSDRPHFRQCATLFLQGTTQRLDTTFRLRRKDGEWIYLHLVSHALSRHRDGRTTRAVGVVLDITEQMRSREVLRAQRDLSMSLASATTLQEAARLAIPVIQKLAHMDSISIYDMAQDEQQLQLLHIVGLCADNMDVLRCFDSASPQYKSILTGKPLYTRCDESSTFAIPELRIHGLQSLAVIPLQHENRIAGVLVAASCPLTFIPVEYRFILESLGSQLAIAFLGIKAQEALRKSEAKYRDLINTIPHGIVEFDVSGRIRYCNHVIAERYGKTPDEMIGLYLKDFLPDENSRQEMTRLLNQALLHTPPPTPVSLTVTTARGNKAVLQGDWNYSYDANGGIRGITVIVTDITERALAEQALREAHEELEQRVEKRTLSLRKTSEQLRRLAARQEECIEEERKRIAREIHDELGQNLTAMKIGLSILSGKFAAAPDAQQEIRTRITDLTSNLEHMLKSVQRICQELRPAQLDDLGLHAAIAWRMREFEKSTGVRTVFNMEPTDMNLPPELTTTVYRLVQEALTNVARHAGASLVNVDLTMKDTWLSARVQDNGRGFDAAALRETTSFGILGMQERMRNVGGTLVIESAPHKGTTVLASFPLISRKGNRQQ